jgi:hypothetical protein
VPASLDPGSKALTLSNFLGSSIWCKLYAVFPNFLPSGKTAPNGTIFTSLKALDNSDADQKENGQPQGITMTDLSDDNDEAGDSDEENDEELIDVYGGHHKTLEEEMETIAVCCDIRCSFERQRASFGVPSSCKRKVDNNTPYLILSYHLRADTSRAERIT